MMACAALLSLGALHASREAFFDSIFGTLNPLAGGDALGLQRFARHFDTCPTLRPILDAPAPSALTATPHPNLPALAAYRQ